MSNNEPAKCARCRQPLTQGSGFCVSCGHTNEASLVERRVKLVGQANERIGWAKRLAEWARGLGLFRRF